MLDYLITNGKIVDGSGNAPFYGEIGVEGDTITLVSENRPEGGPASDKPPSKTVIDAAGLDRMIPVESGRVGGLP